MPRFLNAYQSLDADVNTLLKTNIKRTEEWEREIIRSGGVIKHCLDGTAHHVQEANIEKDQLKFEELNKSGFPRPKNEKDKKFVDYSEGIGQSVNAIMNARQASVKQKDEFAARYPKSDYAALPPAQRKRRISADLGTCQVNITKKEKEVSGVKLLYKNYAQNPSLGNADTVKPQVERTEKELQRLKQYKQGLDEQFKLACSMLDNLTTGSSSSNIYESPPRKFSSPESVNSGMSHYNKGMTQSNASSSSSLQKFQPDSAKQQATISATTTQKFVPPPPPPPTKDIPKKNTNTIGYDFAGNTDEGTISVKANEQVEIISPDEGDGWTEVKCMNGKQGFVPTGYILQ